MFRKEFIIFSDTPYKDKFEVIHAMTHLPNDKVIDPEQYELAVKNREAEVSTYVGFDIAIPHAVTSSVLEPFVIYQRLNQMVAWGEGGETIAHVFLIGVPEGKGSKQHLRILSELSKSLVRDNYRNQLLASNHEDDVYHLLKQIEERI